MGSSPANDIGSTFWGDLRLIRQNVGIPLEHIQRETRIPITVLSEFEASGLVQSPRFNVVYLRSIVREYCKSIGVQEEDGLRAQEESLKDQYRGGLAVKYLDLEPPDPDDVLPPVEPSDAEDVETAVQVDAVDRAPPEEPPTGKSSEMSSISLKARVGWPLGIVAALIVLIAAIWLISSREGSADRSGLSTEANVSTVDKTTVSADADVRFDAEAVFGDSVRINVVASFGKLEPIRVRIDSGESIPHWVEEGDSIAFAASSEIALRGWLNRATVKLAGENWPMETRDAQGQLVVTRERAIAYLDSVKNTPTH